MSRGAHLAGGIVFLWLACVCYYVAFTMGHTSSSPGYLTKTERQLATILQTRAGSAPSATTTAALDLTTAPAQGTTMGGGV